MARVSLGLVVLLVALALGDVPASWRVKFDAGELLYAAVTPEAQLNATIGNGFVATSVGSDTVFMAGVYNGYNNTTPSHRARIVGYPSLTFTVAGETLAGYALDLTEAVFMHRTTLGQQSSVVQRSTYAHRVRRNLIVVEAALLEGTSPVSLISAVNLGAPSTDVSVPVRAVENDGIVVYSFQTLLSEDPWVPAINIIVDGAAQCSFTLSRTTATRAYRCLERGIPSLMFTSRAHCCGKKRSSTLQDASALSMSQAATASLCKRWFPPCITYFRLCARIGRTR
jgi:hypothetical protein